MEAGKDHTKRLHVGLPLPWPGGMREDAEPFARARTSRPATEEASPKREDLRLVRNAEVHVEADRDARREPGSKDPESNEDDAHASRSSLDRTCFRSRRACRIRSDRARRNTSAFASTSEHVLRLRRAPPGVVRSWCDALDRTCGFTRRRRRAERAPKVHSRIHTRRIRAPERPHRLHARARRSPRKAQQADQVHRAPLGRETACVCIRPATPSRRP